MINIEIRYLPPMSIKLNKTKEKLELKDTNPTVKDLIKKLEKKHGEKFKKNIYCYEDNKKTGYKIIAIRNSKPTNLLDKIEDGDTITFAIALSGG